MPTEESHSSRFDDVLARFLREVNVSATLTPAPAGEGEQAAADGAIPEFTARKKEKDEVRRLLNRLLLALASAFGRSIYGLGVYVIWQEAPPSVDDSKGGQITCGSHWTPGRKVVSDYSASGSKGVLARGGKDLGSVESEKLAIEFVRLIDSSPDDRSAEAGNLRFDYFGRPSQSARASEVGMRPVGGPPLEGVSISLARQPENGSGSRPQRLWIVFSLGEYKSGPETARKTVRDLLANQQHLGMIFRICRVLFGDYRALLQAIELAALASLSEEVTELSSATVPKYFDRLGTVCDWLEDFDLDFFETSRENAVRLLKRLAEGVMLEMLGTGWDVHNLEGERGHTRVQTVLSQLESVLVSMENIDSREVQDLRLIDRVLRNAAFEDPNGVLGGIDLEQLERQEDLEGAVDNDRRALMLLAHWTRLHQIALRRSRGEDVDVEESRFFDEVEQSLEPLRKFLMQRFARLGKSPPNIEDDRDGEPSADSESAADSETEKRAKKEYHGFEITYLPSWLRLWFCHELLLKMSSKEFQSRPVSKAQKWRFRAHLAYVVRESLRLFCYGASSNFIYQPVIFAQALRSLVEHHAIWVAHLPRELDLRGILEEIGNISHRGSAYFAAGHLQHVLEMYIGGQFLCEVRIDPGEQSELSMKSDDEEWAEGRWTLLEVLAGRSAWRPGEFKVAEFRKAFCISVLLHDVGVVLFPFWTRKAEELGNVDRPTRHRLRKIRGVLEGSATEFLEKCRKELLESGYFDPILEPKLAAWFDEAIERGIPDHSILGAWYLHRLCQSLDSLSSDVIRQAVRAVLLHSISVQEVRADSDPTAALLLLCDEIFVWNVATETPQASSAGRLFHAIAGEARPQGSPFEKLVVKGLKMVDGDLEEYRQGGRADDEQDVAGRARSGIRKRLVPVLRLGSEGGTLPSSQGPVWPHFDILLNDPDYLTVPVHHLWLRMAQNLGRIVPSKLGFGPALVLRSRVPGKLPEPLDTQTLLGLAADRARFGLRPCLERWLSRKEVFAVEEDVESKKEDGVESRKGDGKEKNRLGEVTRERFEEVRLVPLSRFHHRDIGESLSELDDIIEAIMREHLGRVVPITSKPAPTVTAAPAEANPTE